MHFDFYYAVALAIFAATTFHIEAEPPGFVAANTGFGRASKQFANGREYASISGWIGPRRAAYRRLVYDYNFV
jgi:hypothetical protein